MTTRTRPLPVAARPRFRAACARGYYLGPAGESAGPRAYRQWCREHRKPFVWVRRSPKYLTVVVDLDTVYDTRGFLPLVITETGYDAAWAIVNKHGSRRARGFYSDGYARIDGVPPSHVFAVVRLLRGAIVPRPPLDPP